MRIALLFVLFHTAFICHSQSGRPKFAWEAATSLNYSYSDRWSFYTSIGKRSLWVETDDEDGLDGNFLFIDLDQFATYKLSRNFTVSGGYKYRRFDPFEDTEDYEHRATQQLGWVHFQRTLRLVSRVRLEQRFSNLSFAHRYRYRLSGDLPLSGENLDQREFYMVLSNELLYERVDNDLNTWENRIAVSLGYLFNTKWKVELQLEYRLDDLSRSVEDVPFIHTRAFYRLN